MSKTIVYLYHLERPVHHAQHYLGCTTGTAEKRLQRHLKDGNGLVQAGARLGRIVIARTWEFEDKTEAFQFEKKLKRLKNNRKLCPLCQEVKGGR